MVYLIVNKVENFCKIGFSNNPDARLKQLQTGNPYPLELISTIEGSIIDEKNLHNKFAHLSIQGEWFEYNEEIKTYFGVNEDVFYHVFINFIKRLHEFNSVVDIKVLNYLCSIAEFNTGTVYLTTERKKYICKEINLKYQSVANSLTALKKKGFINGGGGTYIINPAYFWKGDLKTRETLLKENRLSVNIDFDLQ